MTVTEFCSENVLKRKQEGLKSKLDICVLLGEEKQKRRRDEDTESCLRRGL